VNNGSEQDGSTRAGGVLTGLGSAGGSLAVGADTPLGQILILFSPLAAVVIEWAAAPVGASATR
jgi:hypothetical protein